MIIDSAEKAPVFNVELELVAWILESSHRKAVVEGTLGPAGEVSARCQGTFVSVKPDHLAFHRW